MSDILLLKDSNTTSFLKLWNLIREDDARLDWVTVTLHGDGLDATAQIDAFMINGLIDFFNDLNLHWKGWEGTKEFYSIDESLCIQAKHDGVAYAKLRVILDSVAGRLRGWHVELDIDIDLGELNNVASSIASFYGNPS